MPPTVTYLKAPPHAADPNIDIVGRQGHILFLLKALDIISRNSVQKNKNIKDNRWSNWYQHREQKSMKIMPGRIQNCSKMMPWAWCFWEGCPGCQNEERMLTPRVRFGDHFQSGGRKRGSKWTNFLAKVWQKTSKTSIQKYMSKMYEQWEEKAPKCMLKSMVKSMTNRCDYGTCDF